MHSVHCNTPMQVQTSHACPVWHYRLTVAQSKALEFLQKTALNIFFPGGEYATNLIIANVKTLSDDDGKSGLFFRWSSLWTTLDHHGSATASTGRSMAWLLHRCTGVSPSATYQKNVWTSQLLECFPTGNGTELGQWPAKLPSYLRDLMPSASQQTRRHVL